MAQDYWCYFLSFQCHPVFDEFLLNYITLPMESGVIQGIIHQSFGIIIRPCMCEYMAPIANEGSANLSARLSRKFWSSFAEEVY